MSEFRQYESILDMYRDDRFPYLKKLPISLQPMEFSLLVVLNKYPLKPKLHQMLLKARSATVIGVLVDHLMKIAPKQGIDPRFVETVYNARRRKKSLNTTYWRDQFDKAREELGSERIVEAGVSLAEHDGQKREQKFSVNDLTINFALAIARAPWQEHVDYITEKENSS